MRGRSAALLAMLVLAGGCGGNGPLAPPSPAGGPGPAPPPPPPAATTWDVDSLGIPRFVEHDYIDLDRIRSVSRFRSGIGHDYSDALESCRSMKHYFFPVDSAAAVAARIYSPVDGTVAYTTDEWAGTQVGIRPAAFPAFMIILFHVRLTTPLAEGQALASGEPLGTHVGPQTYSDVAVRVETPGGMRLVSWFDTMTDALFAGYAARGVPDRAALIISKAERDADPLTCSGETFTGPGTLPGWVDLP